MRKAPLVRFPSLCPRASAGCLPACWSRSLVGIGAVTTGLIYPLINSGLFILTSIAELVLVFVLSARVQKLQPSTATGIFFGYAVLNGLNLSCHLPGV